MRVHVTPCSWITIPKPSSTWFRTLFKNDEIASHQAQKVTCQGLNLNWVNDLKCLHNDRSNWVLNWADFNPQLHKCHWRRIQLRKTLSFWLPVAALGLICSLLPRFHKIWLPDNIVQWLPGPKWPNSKENPSLLQVDQPNTHLIRVFRLYPRGI